MTDKLKRVETKSGVRLKLGYSNDVRDFRIEVKFDSYNEMRRILELAIIFNEIIIKKYSIIHESEIKAIADLLGLSDRDRDIICSKYSNSASDNMPIEMWMCGRSMGSYECIVNGALCSYTPDYTKICNVIDQILSKGAYTEILPDIKKYLESEHYIRYKRNKKSQEYSFTEYDDYNNRIEISFEKNPIIEITYYIGDSELYAHKSISIISDNSLDIIEHLRIGISNINMLKKLKW